MTARTPEKKQLQRATFSTSRLLDFASVKELTAQTGHDVDEWPLVILKELLDNALDAAEEAGIAPDIAVTVDENGITIRDNGPGIPASDGRAHPRLLGPGLLARSLRLADARRAGQRAEDHRRHAVRAGRRAWARSRSRRRASATGSPSRSTGSARRPCIEHEVVRDTVKTGTEIRVLWPDCACSILKDAEDRFLQIADDFTWLNPNLTLDVDWFGKRRIEVAATTADWPKWRPSDPTSPHWYDAERFKRLIAAYVAHDADNGREPDGARVRRRVPRPDRQRQAEGRARRGRALARAAEPPRRRRADRSQGEPASCSRPCRSTPIR